METGDLVFKLRLRFDICCMASEERRVLQQVEEDPSLLYCRSSSMCPHFRIKNWGGIYLKPVIRKLRSGGGRRN